MIPRVAALRLEAFLADPALDELGLKHLDKLRAEVAKITKPGPSARERVAAGPEQTALPLRREVR